MPVRLIPDDTGPILVFLTLGVMNIGEMENHLQLCTGHQFRLDAHRHGIDRRMTDGLHVHRYAVDFVPAGEQS